MDNEKLVNLDQKESLKLAKNSKGYTWEIKTLDMNLDRLENLNEEMKRRILTDNEIRQEVETLEKQGHKRLLMLMGEHFKEYSFGNFLNAIKVAYSAKTKPGGEIRRINVEIPPLSIQDFKKLKKAKIGTYTMFQETYHRETYEKMHPSGKKSEKF